jgi:hypothetical protein
VSGFFVSRYMPCPECGASVEASASDEHVCEPERVLQYRTFQLGSRVEDLERGFRDYLESPEGRFAQWLAEREREPPSR